MCSMNVNKHNIDIDIIIKKADAIRDFISMREDIDISALDKRTSLLSLTFFVQHNMNSVINVQLYVQA